MRTVDKRVRVSRRDFMVTSGAAAFMITNIAVIHTQEAWGLEVKALRPATMRTLIQVARDIYPHKQLADKYYAMALMGYDEQAQKDPDLKTLIEMGVSGLDLRSRDVHHRAYAEVTNETDRVAMLKEIEGTKFFQKIRSGLVTGLYNNKEVWPLFGYEGSSWEQGGYIHRGFNDLDWL
ncbi:MAG TPA: Twin-arginine translocation pathway signal [Hypericibacter adhaerens]|jgi:hypothetical protein|uniref:Twin-arginine translocation pathway signal n=1 Tax=Hypericibacter adhaerens TaxID=2602016 RepID=A0A5J6MYG5_9PROT|nr:Twin-arginine translocation pathway signal [Hypericibacter adhaerens]QEX22812.1 hypothetical protein FRZ61_27440 [Hypericibacter adhaerens]HWA44961.1 Twin-arginine translocation pathway signal [Hypericibacter adhaerens]